MFKLLDPYIKIIAVVGVLAVVGYVYYLYDANGDLKEDLKAEAAKVKTLTDANTGLVAQIKTERAEIVRLNGIDHGVAKVETVIETQFVEVVRYVTEYRESPNANKCTIDSDFVRIFDASLALGGESTLGITSPFQGSASSPGTPRTLTKEQLSQYTVKLADALDVLVRNNKKYTVLRERYLGLYEACVGTSLIPGQSFLTVEN